MDENCGRTKKLCADEAIALVPGRLRTPVGTKPKHRPDQAEPGDNPAGSGRPMRVIEGGARDAFRTSRIMSAVN